MRYRSAIIIAALASAGCGSTSASAPPANEVPPALEVVVEEVKAQNCEQLFVDGGVITAEQWNQGCESAGAAQLFAYWDCTNGSTLHQNEWGWAIAGEPFHAVAGAASDPGYALAYDACLS